jgi:hypothetical protein
VLGAYKEEEVERLSYIVTNQGAGRKIETHRNISKNGTTASIDELSRRGLLALLAESVHSPYAGGFDCGFDRLSASGPSPML